MDQIVSREMMFNRGVAACEANRPRDSHGMNETAPALADWRAGYDYAQQAKYDRLTRKQADICRAVPAARASNDGEELKQSLFAMVR